MAPVGDSSADGLGAPEIRITNLEGDFVLVPREQPELEPEPDPEPEPEPDAEQPPPSEEQLMTPASEQITEYVRELLKPLQPNILPTNSPRPLARGRRDRLRVVHVDDASEQTERTTIGDQGAQGRALELDIVVEARVTESVYDSAFASATRTAALAEALLLERNGIHQVSGASVQVERAGQVSDTSREGEADYAVLTTQYSIFYRVRRGAPHTIVS